MSELPTAPGIAANTTDHGLGNTIHTAESHSFLQKVGIDPQKEQILLDALIRNPRKIVVNALVDMIPEEGLNVSQAYKTFIDMRMKAAIESLEELGADVTTVSFPTEEAAFEKFKESVAKKGNAGFLEKISDDNLSRQEVVDFLADTAKGLEDIGIPENPALKAGILEKMQGLGLDIDEEEAGYLSYFEQYLDARLASMATMRDNMGFNVAAPNDPSVQFDTTTGEQIKSQSEVEAVTPDIQKIAPFADPFPFKIGG